jgi:NADH:ubiquinone oxidoreductase subunit C
MENNLTIESLQSAFPNVDVNQGTEIITISADAANYTNIAQTLRDQYGFNFLLNMTGVDETPQLTIICHLRNTETKQMLVLRTSTNDREQPLVESLSQLWPAAIYFEREIYDLLGIKFSNHPDMRRIFLDDDYPGFPLRKDFKDTINTSEN